MNMPVRNIVLIVRPMHLFNVYEYMKLHPDEHFDIYIELNSNVGESEVLKKFSSFLRREGVTIKTGTFLSKLEAARLPLFYLKVLFGLDKNVKYHAFLTSVGVRARVIYKLADFEKIILMDEGRSSLQFFPPIVARKKLFSERHTAKKFLRMLYRLMQIHDLDRHKPIEIFTIYEELLHLAESVPVTLNKYSFVRDMFKDCVVEKGTALVLGTTYYVFNFTTEDFTKIVREKLQGLDVKRTIYKYHKLEDNVPLDIPGIEIMRTDLPVEFYFLANNFLPEYIICFNSTVNQIMQKVNENVKVLNVVFEVKTNKKPKTQNL